jgi:N-acetylglucosamine-6-sulfatase
VRFRRREAFRRVLWIVVVLVAAGGVAGSSGPPVPTGGPAHPGIPAVAGAALGRPPTPGGVRPNLVFLITDDLDADSVRYMPQLQRLLVEPGVSLSNYYVSLPWCCPSRATILRGQYAHNTGVWTVTSRGGGFAKFHEAGLERSTIATWLRRAGYRTGLFGKYLNGYENDPPEGPERRTYVPPGWDTWAVPAAGAPYSEFDYTLNVDGRLKPYGDAAGDYLTDVIAKRAGKFVKDRDKRPFFAYISTFGPHRPATPAPRHDGLFDGMRAPRTPSFDAPDASMAGKPAALRGLPPVGKAEARRWDRLYRNRLRSLLAVDEMIGRLVRALAKNGRLSSTYFIFTSDNGFHIGQHRMAPGKNTPYEEDVRVPFVVRGPGVPAGRSVDALAGNVDVAPTLADLAGVAVPRFVDGRSLAPLLRPPVPAAAASARVARAAPVRTAPARTAYLIEQGRIPGTRNNPKHRKDTYLRPFSALRTRRFLYVEYNTGERELYDMANDPFQINNIAAGNPLVAQFSARLARLRSCVAESCRAIEAEP